MLFKIFLIKYPFVQDYGIKLFQTMMVIFVVRAYFNAYHRIHANRQIIVNQGPQGPQGPLQAPITP